ncbi:unnamed protein product [Lactuca saligna]|uniref:Uncharacterized protein n=1 Tax=Lactuca saligna TaxID=75948 RepID=A0AA35VGM0_LACSI|nr:unnamed protein product [Lactuca saligna]
MYRDDKCRRYRRPTEMTYPTIGSTTTICFNIDDSDYRLPFHIRLPILSNTSPNPATRLTMMTTNKLKFNTDLFSILLCYLTPYQKSREVGLGCSCTKRILEQIVAFSHEVTSIKAKWEDYNLIEGRHAPVYDISTANETWEWVYLAEIQVYIQWEGEDPGIPHKGAHSYSNKRG